MLINLLPLIGMAALSAMTGRKSHGARRGFGRSRRSAPLFDLLNVCYGNSDERFSQWNATKPTNPAFNTAVHSAINQGAWYDLKPGENRPTTSGLGPGIIEIKEKEPAPPSPPPPPASRSQDEEKPDQAENPLEFLEVPDEAPENSLALKALRIIIAAGHADGELNGKERELIDGELGKLSDEEAAMIRGEINHPQPIDKIIAGVVRMEDRKFLFGLAALALRADGKVTAYESQFAGKLATALKLDKQTALDIIRAVKR